VGKKKEAANSDISDDGEVEEQEEVVEVKAAAEVKKNDIQVRFSHLF